MTIEELTKKVEELEGGNAALANQNTKLLKEKKDALRKLDDNGADNKKFYDLQDAYDELKNNFDKSEHELKKSNTDLLKVTELYDGSQKEITTNLIDGGISKALNSLEKHKLNEGALSLAMMDIKASKPSIVDGEVMIGDKKLGDYISTTWLENSSSKNLVTPNENSGGGAGGSNNNGGQQTKGNLEGTKAEQEAYIKAKFDIK